ncbi:MAG: hypothetical protein ACRDEA_07545 [Microcystaceae cyanobacterium]
MSHPNFFHPEGASLQQNETDNLQQGAPRSRSGEASGSLRERVIDVITGFRGIVVGIDEQRVMYECREFGRVSRHRDLVLKMRNVQ